MTTKPLKLTLAALLSLSLFVYADGPKPADDAKPRLDAHGDPLPTDAVARLGNPHWRHEAGITFLAYTPDGKQLVTATAAGLVHVWEAATGRELRHFGHGFSTPYLGVALSPDGKMVALSSRDGHYTVWEVATGKEIASFQTDRAATNVFLVFAPDNKSFFVRGTDQLIHQFDVAEKKQIRTFGEPPTVLRRVSLHSGLGSVTISPDGKTLLAGAIEFKNNKTTMFVRSWEIESGKELPAIDGPEGAFTTIAFSPDARRVAWGSNRGPIPVWDLATGKEATVCGTMNQVVYSMSFSRDGRMLLVRAGSERALQLWSVAEGKERLTIKESPSTTPLGSLRCNPAQSPDGRLVASGTRNNLVRQFDLATGEEVGAETAGHFGPVTQLALSSTGTRAVTYAGHSVVHQWDATTGKETGRNSLPMNANQAALSADGKVLALGFFNGVVVIWDVLAEKERKQWQSGAVPNQYILAIALSPDGKTVAVRNFDYSIRLWDSNGGDLRLAGENAVEPGAGMVALPAQRPVTASVVFSPDGTRLAALAGDAGVGQPPVVRPSPVVLRLWDVATGKLLRKFEAPANTEQIAAFAFSPDGRTLTTLTGRLIFWECATGKERGRLDLDTPIKRVLAGMPGSTPLVYSPDGKLLAVGNQDGKVYLCDLTTGKERAILSGNPTAVHTVAFAANGRYLASGGNDATALIWEVPATKEKPPAPVMDARQVEALWEDLSTGDASRGYQAVRGLSRVPDQVVPLCKELLRPVAAPDAAKVAQLLADLDSNVFATRKKAETELEKLGELAEAPLRQAIKDKPPLEMQKRLEGLLSRVATDVVPTGDQLRTLRALEVLEAIGTPEARAVIQRIAGGAAGARVTRDAQGAVERLGKAPPN